MNPTKLDEKKAKAMDHVLDKTIAERFDTAPKGWSLNSLVQDLTVGTAVATGLSPDEAKILILERLIERIQRYLPEEDDVTILDGEGTAPGGESDGIEIVEDSAAATAGDRTRGK